MGFASVVVVVGSFASLAVALVGAVIPSTLAVLAAVQGRAMIQAIADEHALAVAELELAAPDGAGPTWG